MLRIWKATINSRNGLAFAFRSEQAVREEIFALLLSLPLAWFVGATAMRAANVWVELDQQIHYVTALCYPFVAEAKSLQDVYKDAYLAPGSTNPTADSLPDDARKRMRRVVRERDVALVRPELDHILGRFEPRSA